MASFQVIAFVHSLSLSSLPEGSPVTSRSECISTCYFDVKCSSFFFDSSSHMCHPSQSVYGESEAAIPSTGLQYFVWSAGMCYPGYVWSRYLNLCYKLYNTLKTWDDAESQCVSDGGHLISVNSHGVNSLVIDLVDSTGDSLWIGGHAYGAFSITWEWRDGSEVQFDSWGSSQGDGGLMEPCMFVDKGEKKWHDGLCFLYINYLCEHPTPTLHKC